MISQGLMHMHAYPGISYIKRYLCKPFSLLAFFPTFLPTYSMQQAHQHTVHTYRPASCTTQEKTRKAIHNISRIIISHPHSSSSLPSLRSTHSSFVHPAEPNQALGVRACVYSLHTLTSQNPHQHKKTCRKAGR